MTFNQKIIFSSASIAIIFLFGTLAWFVWSFAQRGLQVRTFADMKIISRALEEAAGSTDAPSLDPIKASKIVNGYNNGKDAWGSDFLLVISEVKGHLLISKGQDKILNVNAPEEYFSLEKKYIKDKFTEDIVFRNYEPVTLAGK